MRRAIFLAEGSEHLTGGETVLWQGRPLVGGLVRHLFHLRVIVGYFAVLAAWELATTHADGLRANAAFIAVIWTVAPAFVAAALVYAMAWVLAATTHYTITDRRVIMQIGIALPIALTLPLRRIQGADVKINADGSGDLAFSLGDQQLAYLLIWPHARPWRFKAAEPMLRAVADPSEVAAVLSRALVAAAPGGEAIALRPTRPADVLGHPVTA